MQFIHSVDSVRLLDALEAEAKRTGRSLPVLLEVNASRESTKQGFAPDDVPSLAAKIRALEAVRVRGLMAMAARKSYDEHRPVRLEEVAQTETMLA